MSGWPPTLLSMSYCTAQVLALASGIYDSINSPSSLSIGYISGWITSSGGMLADLNNRLNTSFSLSGSAPCIVGCFGPNEAAIGSLVFEHDYYKRQALTVMQGMGLTWAGSATSIREGDSAITRESPSKAAAEWRALQKEAQKNLYVAVANWKLGATLAVDVQYAPLAAYPTP